MSLHTVLDICPRTDSEHGPAGTHNSEVQLHREADLPNAATEGGAPVSGSTPAKGGIVPIWAAATTTAKVAGNTVEEGRPSGWGGAALATATTAGKEPPAERAFSHATSSDGLAGRRSGANPRVFTACAKLFFTY